MKGDVRAERVQTRPYRAHLGRSFRTRRGHATLGFIQTTSSGVKALLYNITVGCMAET
jgi:hypothetical protein